MIVYLHGFRSSPRSFKALLLAQRLRELGQPVPYACPQLPASPRAAVESVERGCALGPDDTLIGSSLGGCYATWLAERHGCRAVLLNPAVHPSRDLAPHVGRHAMYHDPAASFAFEPHYIDELARLEAVPLTAPQRYLLIAATGDEVLDWREMVARYPGAQHRIVAGGDHGLSDFAQHVDEVLRFAGVTVQR